MMGRQEARKQGCTHGMALDPEGRRAFLLCGGNHVFTVFDLDGHASVAHLPLPAGADVVKFDPGLKRVYAACASGVIMVVQEDDPNHFRKLEDVRVQPKVHSLAVDTHTHRVYAPEEEEDGKPVARMVVYEPVLSSGLVLHRTIVLPGVKGGFNHMSADAGRQRFFAVASTNNQPNAGGSRSARPWESTSMWRIRLPARPSAVV
jgi:hypothetical protein